MPECLGYAGQVYEYSLGEEKYTFVEDVKHPKSCTILIKGQNDHTIAQLKDAVRDGLRAVYNTLVDKKLIPGAGAFEVAAAHHLVTEVKKTVSGKCVTLPCAPAVLHMQRPRCGALVKSIARLGSHSVADQVDAFRCSASCARWQMPAVASSQAHRLSHSTGPRLSLIHI